MSVVVTAVVHPKPGKLEEALAAYARHIDAVHAEPGCELYALHTDGTSIVVLEKWATRAHLDAHASGAVLAKLGPELDALRERPADVTVLEPRPAGTDADGKGAL
ncbi:putative quinol monooxygenase [Streptacidiphilus fuscans]|uniref:Antibiotic biosynthesis monooxygenase n=1 Tax=Streptacidiphilus fuscans TaxID=2789292 RepID=A0A931FI36_9ACTN|nr:putative quinol monooxygenase [Streptacidiphilus fuscans]MBF9071374.1 antibiotic biosynthesis monooxygenase [Streptacidiphilus fuscans]